MNLPVDSLPKTEIVRPVKQRLREQHGRSRALELIQSDRGPRATSVRRTSRSKNRAAQECRLPCDWFGPPAAFGRASSLDSRRHYFADPPLHVHGGLLVHMLLLLPPSLAPPRPLEPSTPHSHLLEASARAGCGKLLAAPRGATRAARGAVAVVNARGALSTVRAGMDGVTLRSLPNAACAFVVWKSGHPQ